MEVEGKFGFEFVISNEPEMLRQKALSLCVIEEKEREIRTWLDFDDDGNDDDEVAGVAVVVIIINRKAER